MVGIVSKHSQILVLAEDTELQRFVRRYLYELGYGPHQIRDLPLPGNRGCGEQWVRERYTKQVKAYRSRSSHVKTALVVAIDTDKGEVADRSRQLREAHQHAGLAARAAPEEIVHLIPKRSVETWILCLSGTGVDEVEDYSHRRDIGKLIPLAAETFFAWTRPNITPPALCIPSLAAAIPEARRLE